MPSILAATIWFIFITVPLEEALGNKTTELVPLGVKYVVFP
jgi:hypothetical protein